MNERGTFRSASTGVDGDRAANEPCDHLKWLRSADALAGKAPITMALGVLVLSERLARRDFLLLTPGFLNEIGLDRTGAYRALRDLETAGLVTVRRCRGRSPLVSILDPGDEGRDATGVP